jgi:hypothetical protein
MVIFSNSTLKLLITFQFIVIYEDYLPEYNCIGSNFRKIAVRALGGPKSKCRYCQIRLYRPARFSSSFCVCVFRCKKWCTAQQSISYRRQGSRGQSNMKKFVQYLCTERLSIMVLWGSEPRNNVLARASNNLAVSQSVLAPIFLLNKVSIIYQACNYLIKISFFPKQVFFSYIRRPIVSLSLLYSTILFSRCKLQEISFSLTL